MKVLIVGAVCVGCGIVALFMLGIYAVYMQYIHHPFTWILTMTVTGFEKLTSKERI